MKYWVTCCAFTVQVDVDDAGVIVFAAPMVRRFLGQPLDSLVQWARRIGACKVHRLN